MGFLAIQLISPHGALTLLGATNEDLNIISSKMKIQFRAGIKKKKKRGTACLAPQAGYV